MVADDAVNMQWPSAERRRPTHTASGGVGWGTCSRATRPQKGAQAPAQPCWQVCHPPHQLAPAARCPAVRTWSFGSRGRGRGTRLGSSGVGLETALSPPSPQLPHVAGDRGPGGHYQDEATTTLCWATPSWQPTAPGEGSTGHQGLVASGCVVGHRPSAWRSAGLQARAVRVPCSVSEVTACLPQGQSCVHLSLSGPSSSCN